MEHDDTPPPPSELPYDVWTEDALRLVVVRALQHAAAEGLPGEHHFYITFRTDFPGVAIPPRLLAKYPQEMTIVLQHQFWDLKVDPEAARFSIGLSFGGIASTLLVPLAAVTGFADPYVRFGLRFNAAKPLAPAGTPPAPLAGTPPDPVPASAEPPAGSPAEPGAVVSLDKFRRRKE